MDEVSFGAVDLNQLKDVFVDGEQFEEEEDEDNLFEDINGTTDGAKFVRAIQKNTGNSLICKVFNPELLKQDAPEPTGSKKDQCWYRQLMLLREVIFLKELRHPAIVDFRGFNLYNSYIQFSRQDEEEDPDPDYSNPTIFLEFLQNKSLHNIIENEAVDSLDPVKRQICMIGLSAAVFLLHRKNVLHRNLNPKTIWLDENFYPKIFDFSSSRESNHSMDANKTILNIGCTIYQAPEFFDNSSGDYDTPADIFALGRLLYFFITGSEPFQMKNDPLRKEAGYKLMAKIKNQEYPMFPSTVSPELQDLLKKCWSYSPSERPVANEIFYNLTYKKKYRIVEFNKEINDYIEKIEKFEQEFRPSKLEICANCDTCIDIPEFQVYTDDTHIPEKESEQVSMLLNIINSNFAEGNEKTLLDLLNVMAGNGTILKEDYLPKVINYVNDLSAKENKLADQFLTKVFGNYIVDPSKTTEIVKGSISNEQIKTANVPKGVKKIGKNAFSGFKNLERVNLPNTVLEIEDEAFSECPCLVTVNIPESVKDTNLGKGVFKNCKQLNNIRIPSKITKIQESTFKGDKSLSNILLGSGLQNIGPKAFYGCESLKYVEIPKRVKVLETKAFHHCPNLGTIYFLGKKPKTERKALNWKVKHLP